MTTFLKYLFFSQKSTFLKFWKPIWLSIPRGLWPYNFFPDILILRGQNHENITREIFARHRIAIWGLRSARIKNMKKTDPHFFQKKWGSVFFNFLIWALLRPQIAIRRHANISRVIIHIRIVLNNAKYLITWSNFVGFGNSRYQQKPEIISYAFEHFPCRWQ